MGVLSNKYVKSGIAGAIGGAALGGAIGGYRNRNGDFWGGVVGGAGYGALGGAAFNMGRRGYGAFKASKAAKEVASVASNKSPSVFSRIGGALSGAKEGFDDLSRSAYVKGTGFGTRMASNGASAMGRIRDNVSKATSRLRRGPKLSTNQGPWKPNPVRKAPNIMEGMIRPKRSMIDDPYFPGARKELIKQAPRKNIPFANPVMPSPNPAYAQRPSPLMQKFLNRFGG